MIAPIAAILAALVARRSPGHRPLAIGMGVLSGVGIAVELVRAAGADGLLSPGVSSRSQLALHLATTASSAWAIGRSFRLAAPWYFYAAAWFVAALAVAFTPVGPWWSRAHPAAMTVCCAAQVLALGAWMGRGGLPSITQRTARLITACDVVGLVLGTLLGWERVGIWGSVSAAGAVVMQAVWLARVRIRVG